MTWLRLLLGQASSVRVFMICPINRKKLAPSSCSGVTKTIWKDISTTPFMRNQLKQSMSKHLPPTKESKSSKATTNHGEPKTKRQDSVKCSSLWIQVEFAVKKAIAIHSEGGWTIHNFLISHVILLLEVIVLYLNFTLACKPELLWGMSTEISKTSAIRILVMVSAFAATKALVRLMDWTKASTPAKTQEAIVIMEALIF